MSERLKFLTFAVGLVHDLLSNKKFEDVMGELTDYIVKLNYSQYLEIRDVLYPPDLNIEEDIKEIKDKLKKSINKHLSSSLINLINKFLDPNDVDIYSVMGASIFPKLLDPIYIVDRSEDAKVVQDTIERNPDDILYSTLGDWVKDNAKDYSHPENPNHEKWVYITRLLKQYWNEQIDE